MVLAMSSRIHPAVNAAIDTIDLADRAERSSPPRPTRPRGFLELYGGRSRRAGRGTYPSRWSAAPHDLTYAAAHPAGLLLTLKSHGV
jgi:hypothetical protein